MWHSEDDIIKDLASLNDFGAPGDTEPYKVLYSNGRGSRRIHKSHTPKTFVDPRNGDVLDLTDLTQDLYSNEFSSSRGRGSALGKLARKNIQLQNQLRLARPSGSSDAIIETYLRKNQPSSSKSVSKPSVSETLTKENPEKNRTSPNSFLNGYEETKRRIKGVRCSSSQSNALLTSLLSKAKATMNSNSISTIDEKISLKSNSVPDFDKSIDPINREFGSVESGSAPKNDLGEMSDSSFFKPKLINGYRDSKRSTYAMAAKFDLEKASMSSNSEEFFEPNEFPPLKRN